MLGGAKSRPLYRSMHIFRMLVLTREPPQIFLIKIAVHVVPILGQRDIPYLSTYRKEIHNFHTKYPLYDLLQVH